jgi:hypothetical protein
VPDAVKWAARLIFISGAVSVLAVLPALSNLAVSLSSESNQVVNWSGVVVLILVLLLELGVGVGILVFLGVMILRRANWARYCFIALCGLDLLWALVAYHHQQEGVQSAGGPWVEYAALVGLSLLGIAAYLLLRREASWWFKNR